MNLREDGFWTLSNLAEKRAAQRNVDPRLFGLLHRYGKRFYLGGDLHIFVSEGMVPAHEALLHDLRRIKNTMAVIARDGTVKTVWKDARALSKLRRRRLRKLRLGRGRGKKLPGWLH